MAKLHSSAALRGGPHLDRRGVNAFIDRHLLVWDVGMACLALLYLGIGFIEDNPASTMSMASLMLAEYVITAIFLAEFLLRLYVAPSRGVYVRKHWIDLLALLPAVRWMRFLRLARFARVLELARLLRLGILVRVLVELDRVIREMRHIAVRNGVHVFLLIAIGLVAAGGTLVWALEHAINPSLRSFPDAIWWAFATVTTIGYGNGPTTLAGRAIAAVVMVVGISCFGVISATITTYFVQQVPPAAAPAPQTVPDELKEVLEDIRARLARLEQDNHADKFQPEGDHSTVSPPRR